MRKSIRMDLYFKFDCADKFWEIPQSFERYLRVSRDTSDKVDTWSQAESQIEEEQTLIKATNSMLVFLMESGSTMWNQFKWEAVKIFQMEV